MNKYSNRNLKGGVLDQSNYFKGERFIKGYGFTGCGIRDQFKRFKNWITPLWRSYIAPKIKEGLTKIGAEAVAGVSNVANDAIAGKDISASIASNVNTSINNVKEAF